MNRIEYTEFMQDRDLALQMGREKRVLQGKPGQAVLRELEEVLLAMRPRRLITDWLCDQEGEVCALGGLARARLLRQGVSLTEAEMVLRPAEPTNWEWDWDTNVQDYAVNELGLSRTLAWLIMEANDDPEGPSRTPEQRYQHVLGKVQGWLAGKVENRVPNEYI